MTERPSLPEAELTPLLERVRAAAADARVADGAPPGGDGQPIHTVYVPADRFDASTVRAFGEEALGLLERHAPDPGAMVAAFGVDGSVAEVVRERVEARLLRLPVEDVRIDLEDGYGVRDDDEEDRHAAAAARAVLEARAANAFSPAFGVRVKSFADGLEGRSIRSLDVFLTSLQAGEDAVPDGFVVTFPKVVTPAHVALFATALERLERALGLTERALWFEVQVETPRSVVGADGRIAAREILDAADGRLSAVHFGVFDYTASLGLMPWEQRLDHPANDLARSLAQVALAGTGVRLSDGSTNVVPASDATSDVHAAWRIHADHVRHSLAAGFVQGWDLHPSHLVSRYAAVYGWLLPHLDDATQRVRAWRSERQAGGVLDEPATVTSLLRYLRFVVRSGAAEEAEVLERAGAVREELFP